MKKLRGSKYVQSNTKNTFSEVKQDLENGKKVLYSGTPCQIAGLKNYLGKEYENLFTVDIVCHGVPSPQLFKKYINNIEDKYKGKITNFSFREKEKRGWGKNLKIELDNGKVIQKFSDLDPYYKSFLAGDICREVCYECKYSTRNRVGDITIADYWGIEYEHPEFIDNNGISAVMLQTQKGKNMWKEIEEEIDSIPTTIEKIAKHNHNLKQPTKRNSIRNNVYKGLENKEFNTYCKENLYFKKKLKDRIKSLISEESKRKLKKMLKK